MDEIKELKKYKTLNEQIDYLISNKRIKPSTIDRSVFYSKSYLSIITPYTSLVCIGRRNAKNINDRKHIYEENTDFNLYLNWNEIDEYISLILREEIGVLENKLKAFLSDKICKMMSDNGDESCCNYNGFNEYRNGKSFLDFHELNKKDQTNGIEELNGYEINSRKKSLDNILKIVEKKFRNNLLLKHYREYKYIPFWILIRVLTIYDLSQLFIMLKMQTKKEFFTDYLSMDKISSKQVILFSNDLHDVSTIRNTINHYEPIIPFFLDFKNSHLQIIYRILSQLKECYNKSNHKTSPIINHPKILTPINDYNKKSIQRIQKILKIIE